MVGLTEARQDALHLSEELAGVSVTLTATQDALAEQKTMRAVGQMAAGAAHELNTPLALISGRAQLMRDKSDRHEDRQAWAGVAQQAQRISDIISELMSFASPPEPKAQACSLGELVDRATESFLSSNHPQVPRISFEKSIGEDLPSAWVDAAQMTGVILELITNAANASPEGGKIVFSGQADEIARRVVLRVMDQGLGMDENTLQSSYTPFFSKHAAGRRRGLGLPLAKRYVENNGGSLWITSKPNQGTEASVTLPIAEVQAT
jgi:signal transduction histidine kinase